MHLTPTHRCSHRLYCRTPQHHHTKRKSMYYRTRQTVKAQGANSTLLLLLSKARHTSQPGSPQSHLLQVFTSRLLIHSRSLPHPGADIMCKNPNPSPSNVNRPNQPPTQMFREKDRETSPSIRQTDPSKPNRCCIHPKPAPNTPPRHPTA